MRTILRTSMFALAAIAAAAGSAEASGNGRGGGGADAGAAYDGGGDAIAPNRLPRLRLPVAYVNGEGYCEIVIYRGGAPLVFLQRCENRR